MKIKEDTRVSDKDSLVADKDENNKLIYVFHANAKNKIGKFVLVATYNGVEYTKTVEITSLW